MSDADSDLGQYVLVFNELVIAARYRGTVTYQELAHVLGLPIIGSYMGIETGKILGRISSAEHASQRPLLSAIAIGVNGMPGPGFFGISRKLGKLKGEAESDERPFWEAEKKAVYERWTKKF